MNYVAVIAAIRTADLELSTLNNAQHPHPLRD